MRLGVDIDGVLSKTFESYVVGMRSLGHDVSAEDFVYEVGFPGIPREVLMSWYLPQKMELRRSYERYPGARAVLHLLAMDVVFITNRPTEEHPCPATLDWLKAHDILIGEVVHTRDKAVECARLSVGALIEDAPHNALAVADAGIPVLLHDQPYNRHVSHPLVTRFSHWGEVPRLLRRMGHRNL